MHGLEIIIIVETFSIENWMLWNHPGFVSPHVGNSASINSGSVIMWACFIAVLYNFFN